MPDSPDMPDAPQIGTSPGLQTQLSTALEGWPIGEPCQLISREEADELALFIIDRRLSDLNVLVKIPAVRELVDCVGQQFAQSWIDALEATR